MSQAPCQPLLCLSRGMCAVDFTTLGIVLTPNAHDNNRIDGISHKSPLTLKPSTSYNPSSAKRRLCSGVGASSAVCGCRLPGTRFLIILRTEPCFLKSPQTHKCFSRGDSTFRCVCPQSCCRRITHRTSPSTVSAGRRPHIFEREYTVQFRSPFICCA